MPDSRAVVYPIDSRLSSGFIRCMAKVSSKRMKSPTQRRYAAACCALLFCTLGVAADDDDAASPTGSAGLPSLTAGQQKAVGILLAHPVPAKAPARLAALGVVLDDAAFAHDAGEAMAAAEAERAATAEVLRLRALYQDGGDASLKLLQAAQVEQARSHAAARSAAAQLGLRWGPLAALPPDARDQLLAQAARGRGLLVRAELPGQHSFGELPRKAMLDVDGVQVPGRVLGPLRQIGESQGAALLVSVDNPPAGLGPGAILPVTLLTSERAGLALPREALLFDEHGAYVYKQLRKRAGDRQTRFAPVKVELVVPYGEGWLVEGVGDDDDIVVRGAGVLWSLQGVGNRAADDDDD